MSDPRASASLITIGIVLLALCGLFILGGAELPFAPHDDIGPEEESLAADDDHYVGDPIATSGEVVDADTNQVHVDADTNRVHVEPDDTDLVVTLEIDPSHDVTLEDGHEVSVSGTIAPERTIVVGPDDHIAVRAPWERTSMDAISLLGAVLTGLLIVNSWRVDPARRFVEPRAEPIVPIRQEDRSDG